MSPQSTATRTEAYPFMDTYRFQLDRQDFKAIIGNSTNLIVTQLRNSIWWSTISNFFYKSTKTLQPTFASSRAFLVFPVTLIKARDVEYCCLNPNCKLIILLLLLKKVYNLFIHKLFKYLFNI